MKNLLIIIFLFLLIACSSTPSNQGANVKNKSSLTELKSQAVQNDKQPQKIKLKVISIVAQEEINAQVQASTSGAAAGAAAGGLLGALIGSALDASKNKSIKNKTEEIISPYRNMLIDYDVRKVVHDKYKEILQDIDKYEVVEYIESSVYDKDLVKPKNHLSKEKNGKEMLLILETNYSLANKLDLLYVTTNATLVLGQLKGATRYYKKKFAAIYQSPYATLDKKRITDVEILDLSEKIKSDYLEKVAGIKRDNTKERLKRQARSKLAKMKRYKYIDIEPPVENIVWSEDTLKEQLARGFEGVIKNVTYALNKGIKLKINKNEKVKLPYVAILPNGKESVKNIPVFPLSTHDGFSKYYINSYQYKKNIYFSVSEKELMKFPTVY